MDMVRGREISREALSDRVAGSETIQGIIRLSQSAPSAKATQFRQMVKYWVSADSATYYANASLEMIARAREINANASSRGELVKNVAYPEMDRAVHLRPGWGLGLASFSSRIGNFEYVNFEGRKAWYTSSGAMYLYNWQADHYSDGYWPTVNAYRIPGTTVDNATKGNGTGHDYRSSMNWVGGTSNGTYGTHGMELDAYDSTLTARKSWFMLDDEVVALGAGVTSSDNRTVETVVENRKLDSSTRALTVDGAAASTSLGWSQTLTGVDWAHLDGTGGYYFPSPVSLKGVREARTGNWQQWHGEGSTTNITRNYLTLWLDHGSNPSNATYAYAVLPGMSSSQVSTYASSPEFTVLANTSAVQAVREPGLGVTAANFWNSGTATAGDITSNAKASVLLRRSGTDTHVSVSDPTQSNTGSITLTIANTGTTVVSADSGVTVSQSGTSAQITVAVNGSKGKTFKVTLRS
jgi:hyaluronate lyase